LSPAGALPFASFAAVSCQARKFGDTIRISRESMRAAPFAAPEMRRVSLDFPVLRASAAELRVWRSPSGPAPSQAPPAA
jgi:hypothetical protein